MFTLAKEIVKLLVGVKGLRNSSLLLLLVSVFGMIFSASAATSINGLQVVRASTEGGSGDDGGGSGGGDDSGEEGDDEPEPEPDPEPESNPEPEPDPIPLPIVPEPVPDPIPEPLPPCDGSAQRCLTPGGDICEVGQGGHECECAEDMSDCPFHPSLKELPSRTTKEAITIL